MIGVHSRSFAVDSQPGAAARHPQRHPTPRKNRPLPLFPNSIPPIRVPSCPFAVTPQKFALT